MSDEKEPPDEEWSPYLPYNGSSGWSGSEASKARADHDDQSGTTSERQRRVLATVEGVGPRGMTWKELADLTGWHHGQASGVLSNLHKAGRLDRLTEKRGRCHPYVTPRNVAGRETAPFGGKTNRMAQAWQAGFYAGVMFESEEGEEYPPNPYDA